MRPAVLLDPGHRQWILVGQARDLDPQMPHRLVLGDGVDGPGFLENQLVYIGIPVLSVRPLDLLIRLAVVHRLRLVGFHLGLLAVDGLTFLLGGGLLADTLIVLIAHIVFQYLLGLLLGLTLAFLTFQPFALPFPLPLNPLPSRLFRLLHLRLVQHEPWAFIFFAVLEGAAQPPRPFREFALALVALLLLAFLPFPLHATLQVLLQHLTGDRLGLKPADGTVSQPVVRQLLAPTRVARLALALPLLEVELFGFLF